MFTNHLFGGMTEDEVNIEVHDELLLMGYDV
jgi:hypothetical protein